MEFDALSRYRFMECLDIAESPETRAEIEGGFAQALTESDLFTLSCAATAFNLWLVSRSPLLQSRLRRFMDAALIAIANTQNLEGSFQTARIDRPSTYLTALVCVVLLRLGRSEWQLERSRNGVQWLAKQQNSDGSWNSEFSEIAESTNGADFVLRESRRPDLSTTLLAAEAIRLSGLSGYQSTLELADSWIGQQQTPLGTWDDGDLPFPLGTILALEYLEEPPTPISSLGNYQQIARSFLMRAREFLAQDNQQARQLAVITAFQAVESFLCACLSSPSLNVSVFKGNQTIGMRSALAQFEGILRKQGTIAPTAAVEYRRPLDRLAYQRDQVVHKGAHVGEPDASELVTAAERFVRGYSRHVFGHTLP